MVTRVPCRHPPPPHRMVPLPPAPDSQTCEESQGWWVSLIAGAHTSSYHGWGGGDWPGLYKHRKRLGFSKMRGNYCFRWSLQLGF